MTPEQIEKWASETIMVQHIGTAGPALFTVSMSDLAEFARLVAQDKDAEIAELKRLLKNATGEVEAMTFNFRVTNKAYIVVDQQMRKVADELKRQVEAMTEERTRIAAAAKRL